MNTTSEITIEEVLETFYYSEICMFASSEADCDKVVRKIGADELLSSGLTPEEVHDVLNEGSVEIIPSAKYADYCAFDIRRYGDIIYEGVQLRPY